MVIPDHGNTNYSSLAGRNVQYSWPLHRHANAARQNSADAVALPSNDRAALPRIITINRQPVSEKRNGKPRALSKNVRRLAGNSLGGASLMTPPIFSLFHRLAGPSTGNVVEQQSWRRPGVKLVISATAKLYTRNERQKQLRLNN